ncbi:hypothetical protein FOXYSP1_08771 [Fusarium oxysporum f. sp. phaseoli]
MQAQTNQSRVPPAGAPKAKWAKDWNNMVQHGTATSQKTH